MTKRALHFPVDRTLPKSLVEKLIGVRLEQLLRLSLTRAVSSAIPSIR